MVVPIVIIGSGPAGISAAWPLVEAGLQVLMLDAAGAVPLPAAPTGTIGELRRSADRAAILFGDQPPRPAPITNRSPKLATVLARAVGAGFHDRLGLTSDGFFTLGTLASGGLTNIWGAMASTLDDRDLDSFPGGAAAMRAAYARVSARIGTGGGTAELAAPIRTLLRHHAGLDDGLALSVANNAVLAEARDGRESCTQCGLCLWGCARRSIYNAADELPALRRWPNFTYRTGQYVQDIVPDAGGHLLIIDGAAPLLVRHVILAAGTIATTALALRRLGAFDVDVRLLNNPLAALATLVPAHIGAPLPERSFSLAQLQFSLGLPGGVVSAGTLYAADTLPASVIADRLPLSRPLALRFARALMPALALATFFLPGSFSRNHIRLASGTAKRLSITGEQPAETRAALTDAGRRLGRLLRRRGAYALPGSLTIAEPGTDIHYAGTLPMGKAGQFGSGADGTLNNCPGIHIVDGACLPLLPAQHCTLTIMANADRIGRDLAQRWVSS
jgi:choline dehydrogenase-like flavoprotein